MPKQEGELGLNRMMDWNRAAVMKHIWNLFTQSGSLWVAWVHDFLLKGMCFWSIKIPLDSSWGWRTIFKLRQKAIIF